MKLIQKKINDKLRSELIENGIAEHTAQLLAARNIKSFADINYSIDMLLPPELLRIVMRLQIFYHKLSLIKKR